MLRVNVAALDRAVRRMGFTANSLADRAGVHRNTIGNIRRSAGDANLGTVARLADALGVSPFVLLEDGPDEPYTTGE